MSILNQYGIKEVADVTLYKLDTNGNPSYPVLYFDTLKVSTIEQTAEVSEAKGGKGASPYIVWDYGKEINLTIQDALCSMKSLGVLVQGTFFHTDTANNARKVLDFHGTNCPTVWVGPNSVRYTIDRETSTIYDAKTGNIVTGNLDSDQDYFICFNIPYEAYEGLSLSSQSLDGTYYLVGDTFARSAITGKDEFFQFVCPKVKIQSNFTLELSADGDPTVFDFNMRCLRPMNGKMMQLIQYDLEAMPGIPLLDSNGKHLQTDAIDNVDAYLLYTAFPEGEASIDIL